MKLMQILHSTLFFFYLGFLSDTLAIHRTAEKEEKTYLFLFTISIDSQTFRHFFAVLYMR